MDKNNLIIPELKQVGVTDKKYYGKDTLEFNVKFPLNSTVYFMNNNSVQEGEIQSISITVGLYQHSFNIKYFCAHKDFGTGDLLFKSKDELLKSL